MQKNDQKREESDKRIATVTQANKEDYLSSLKVVHYAHRGSEPHIVANHGGPEVPFAARMALTSQTGIKAQHQSDENAYETSYVRNVYLRKIYKEHQALEQCSTRNDNVTKAEHGGRLTSTTREEQLDRRIEALGHSHHHIRAKDPEHIVHKEARLYQEQCECPKQQ